MKATKILVLVLFLATVFFGVQYFRSTLAAKASGGDYSAIRSEALAFYQSKYPDQQNLSAKVLNFGCHFEIEILQGGIAIGRVGWAGPGSYYEIR